MKPGDLVRLVPSRWGIYGSVAIRDIRDDLFIIHDMISERDAGDFITLLHPGSGAKFPTFKDELMVIQ